MNFFFEIFLLLLKMLRFYSIFFPQYSFYMHQKYETAIKATHDNSRAIIELHEVHTLIVFMCTRLYMYKFVVAFIVCLVFNTNRTRYKLKNKYDRVQCIVNTQA